MRTITDARRRERRTDVERLTERIGSVVINVKYATQHETAIHRLAAIEDILGDEYDLDRLRELVEADREGKIPKYTIGDTVYDRFGDGWEVDDAELHLLNEKPEWIYRCGHAGTYDYCALWEFEAFPTKEAALRREQDG